MCNLYSIRKGPAAILDLARAMRNDAGNLAPGDIWPDDAAPVVRADANGERILSRARWGMPSPAFALEGKKTDRGVTNIRNTRSPHWRRWLSAANRCLVPLTAFSEPGRNAEGRYEPVWFRLAGDDPEPLAFFAGVWTPRWTSVRKLKEGEVSADLFGFLTCEPNAEVAAVHPKAMPVILTESSELELWMTAPWEVAAELQRPLPDGSLRRFEPTDQS
ncbi:SOS response-associated peptidase family protein [Brevundimonas sp. BAL450]|uniref:SOS response-associated peptidase n=1 Tax=Brevundimonas sp. BAL450 TaxID=1708162 RepID=UPI0018CB57E1|nr:SOS response-associated peptidase family protein [Brevundimonas sp. BAL450]MBG7614656.1 SOS response-associated peptidase family protein [Brevundimonas sp. BAL450]